MDYLINWPQSVRHQNSIILSFFPSDIQNNSFYLLQKFSDGPSMAGSVRELLKRLVETLWSSSTRWRWRMNYTIKEAMLRIIISNSPMNL
ncbi:uncharacterized [Tachysurus ichikawai]